MIERLRHWYWMRRGCRHEWHNTGLSYTDPQHGFTIVLRECRLCDITLIVEV